MQVNPRAVFSAGVTFHLPNERRRVFVRVVITDTDHFQDGGSRPVTRYGMITYNIHFFEILPEAAIVSIQEAFAIEMDNMYSQQENRAHGTRRHYW